MKNETFMLQASVLGIRESYEIPFIRKYISILSIEKFSKLLSKHPIIPMRIKFFLSNFFRNSSSLFF